MSLEAHVRFWESGVKLPAPLTSRWLQERQIMVWQQIEGFRRENSRFSEFKRTDSGDDGFAVTARRRHSDFESVAAPLPVRPVASL